MPTNIDRIRVDRTTGRVGIDASIEGVAPQMDDTDKLAVSLYAENTSPGDSSLKVEAGGQRNLRVAMYAGASKCAIDAFSSDGFSPGTLGLYAKAGNHLYNGSNWDRQRNNVELILLASAARTATTPSPAQVNYNHRGMVIFIDVTARAAACTLTPSLQIADPIGGDQQTIWTVAAAIDTADGSYAYLFYPLVGTDAAELYIEAVDIAIPRTWRLNIVHSTANEITYSVAAAMIL